MEMRSGNRTNSNSIPGHNPIEGGGLGLTASPPPLIFSTNLYGHS